MIYEFSIKKPTNFEKLMGQHVVKYDNNINVCGLILHLCQRNN